MESNRLRRYLCLFHSRVIPVLLFSRLLQHYRCLSAISKVSEDTLTEIGLSPGQAEMLRDPMTCLKQQARVDRDLHWAQNQGHTILCYEDDAYPALLREISAPPPVLFVRGNPGLLTQRQLAIVGSRKATSYGLRNAYWMAYELSGLGLLICSGMARGIDAQAHQASLDSGNATVAVVGTGIDLEYPRGNSRLCNEIASKGAVVSEFAMGTPPLAMNFPRRNRIISGLSAGTLVIEASMRSGSLITARLALEQNRDVFTIPGLISNPLAAGCHRLLSEGARLVTSPADVAAELGILPDESDGYDSQKEDKALIDQKAREQRDIRQQVELKAETRNRNPRAQQAEGNSDKLQTYGTEEVRGIQAKQQRKKGSKSHQLSPLTESSTQSAALNSLLELIDYHGCELQVLLDATEMEYQQLNSVLMHLELQGKLMSEGGRYFRVN